MSEVRKEKIALIKWISGDDEGTFSPDIPISWIKNFDYDKHEQLVMKGKADHPYAIEWRNPKKQPQRGWQCYDGVIIQFAEHIYVPEQTLKMMQGAKSPKKVAALAEADLNDQQQDHQEKLNTPAKKAGAEKRRKNDNDDNASSESSPEILENKKLKKFRRLKFSVDLETTSDDEKIPTTPKKNKSHDKENIIDDNLNEGNISKDVLGTERSSRISPNGRKISTPDKKVDGSTDNVSVPSNKKVHCNQQKLKLSSVMDLLQNIASDLKSVKNDLGAQKKDLSMVKIEMDNLKKNVGRKIENDVTEDDEMKEIVPGSGVTVSMAQWNRAISQDSFSAMGVSLLTALFPMDILLKSNLRGGAPKKSGQKKADPVHDALDPKKLNALRTAVKTYYESKQKPFVNSLLGIALSNKLNAFRNGQKPE